MPETSVASDAAATRLSSRAARLTLDAMVDPRGACRACLGGHTAPEGRGERSVDSPQHCRCDFRHTPPPTVCVAVSGAQHGKGACECNPTAVWVGPVRLARGPRVPRLASKASGLWTPQKRCVRTRHMWFALQTQRRHVAAAALAAAAALQGRRQTRRPALWRRLPPWALRRPRNKPPAAGLWGGRTHGCVVALFGSTRVVSQRIVLTRAPLCCCASCLPIDVVSYRSQGACRQACTCFSSRCAALEP